MIYLIPNFHFDLTWHKDMSTFMRISADIFMEALNILETDPEFRYTVDHQTFLDWFLETHPDQFDRVREQVRAGRLAVVGGMVSMMDCDIPEGEVFARQLLYGQQWLKARLGKRAEVGWLIDNYGYTPQLPQLLQAAGMDALEICLWWAPPEYMTDHIGKSEFRWQGLDGSEVMVHVAMPNYTGPILPGAHSYDDLLVPFDPLLEQKLAEHGLEEWQAQVKPWATGMDLMGHIGGDSRHPVAQLSRYIHIWNEDTSHPAARIAIPDEFFATLRQHLTNMPILRGEISPGMRTVTKSLPDLQALAVSLQHVRPAGVGRFGEGYGEAKVERKQLDREFHNAMHSAEQAATWAWLLGAPSVQNAITELYHPILIYGHHDPFIGCCVIADYDRIIASLRSSIQKAQALGQDANKFIAQHIDTRGEGQPWLVFNPLSISRCEPVSYQISFPPGQAYGVQIFDDRNNPVQSQIITQKTHPDGSLAYIEILSTVDAPACGYQLYFARPVASSQRKETAGDLHPRELENRRYRLTFEESGALLGILDKSNGNELLGEGGIEFILEEDLGCFCHIDPTGRVWSQSDYPLAKFEVIETGPVRWRIVTSNECKGLAYRQEVSIYETLPWIEFHLAMDIRCGEDLRTRVRCALPDPCCEIWSEIPFGALAREDGLMHAVNWVDCGGDQWSLAMLNKGLTSYEVDGDTLYLSLWRGLSLFNNCYGCLQRPQRTPLIENGYREFHFALFPHAGDWRESGLVWAGQMFNNPLQVMGTDTHPGELPQRQQWLTVMPDNVVLTAVKHAEMCEAMVVRLYESHGLATTAHLELPGDFTSWCETNLLEDIEGTTPLDDAGLNLTFRPYEVKTVMLCR